MSPGASNVGLSPEMRHLVYTILTQWAKLRKGSAEFEKEDTPIAALSTPAPPPEPSLDSFDTCYGQDDLIAWGLILSLLMLTSEKKNSTACGGDVKLGVATSGLAPFLQTIHSTATASLELKRRKHYCYYNYQLFNRPPPHSALLAFRRAQRQTFKKHAASQRHAGSDGERVEQASTKVGDDHLFKVPRLAAKRPKILEDSPPTENDSAHSPTPMTSTTPPVVDSATCRPDCGASVDTIMPKPCIRGLNGCSWIACKKRLLPGELREHLTQHFASQKNEKSLVVCCWRGCSSWNSFFPVSQISEHISLHLIPS